MKIYVDLIVFYLQKAGGISVVWNELLERMKVNNNLELIDQNRKCSNIYYDDIISGKKKINKELKLPLKIIRYLPILAPIKERSIVVSSYYRISLSKKAVNIVTVHDFIYEKYTSGIRRLIHCLQKKMAIKYANGIICISESTKQDLLKYYPFVNPTNIKVIYNGVAKCYHKLESPIFPPEFSDFESNKYILFVGGRSSYKKFDFSIDVVAKTNYKFVIVGGGPISQQEKELLDEKMHGKYFHQNNITNANLNLLYNCAHCLIYPSQYEGFGIPIIEARMAGCPVIAHDGSSITEVMDSVGILLDNYDSDLWANAIDKLDKVEYRDQIVKSGYESALKFSWDKSYSKTIKAYEEWFNEK